MATNRGSSVRVPRFSSIDEEREWFERHAEEVDGTELDENPFARRTSKVAYSLRLDAADIEHLEAVARRRGVRPTQLARELILSGLLAAQAEQTAKPALATPWGGPAESAAVAQSVLRDWDVAIAPVIAQMNLAMTPLVAQMNADMAPVVAQMNAAMAPVVAQMNAAMAPVVAQMNAAMAPVVRQLSESMAPLLKQFSAAFTVVEVAEAALAAREADRPGQAVFEFVRVLRPDVAEEVRGTDADPSQDDTRVPIFFERVAALAA